MLIADGSTPTVSQVYTPVQGARWMARKGLRITPLQGKIAFIKDWPNRANTDVEEISKIAQDIQGVNFGCVAKRGEYFMVEEDVPGFFDRFTTETGITLDTFKVQSSRGRLHCYFRASQESDSLLTNIVEKDLGGAASVRWHNYQCVCPFSIHPKTKEPYLPVDIKAEIKPAPIEFIRWILAQRTKAESSPADTPAVRVPRGYHDVTLTQRAGYLRRGGASIDEMEASLIRQIEEEFDNYGSDYQEMARKVARSIGRKPVGDLSPKLLIDGKVPGEAVAQPSENEPQPWADLVPIQDSLSPVMAFDTEFLPDSIKPWVVDVSERMAVPLDFAGICALATLSGVLGRRVFVYPKAKDKDWRESLCLSGAVVAASGKTKTPTWKMFTNVVVEKETDWRNKHKEVWEKHSADLKAWESAEKSAKRKENVEGGTSNPPPPIEPPQCRRLMLNDATPEKMHDVMKVNPSGMFYYRDELSSWIAELDKDGREVQRGLFLAAMNGDDAYTVDRIGRDGGFAIMCANVFGGLQPELFRDFMSNAKNIDDGTIPRFALLVWPDELKLPVIDRPANDEAKQKFRRVVRDFAEMTEKQVAMHFSPEAQTLFNDWFSRLNEKVEAEKNPGKRSHLSKYKAVLPKIAALLQIVDLVGNGELSGNHQIDVAHLKKALGLLRYLENHMHRVYDCTQTPVQKAELAIASHIKDLQSGFTIRTVQRKHWCDLSDWNYIDLALESLAEKGWIRELPQEQKPGRPTTSWEINPALVN